MTIGKTLRRILIAFALTLTTIITAGSPASAAAARTSATIYLEWGNSLKISAPVAASPAHYLYVKARPNGGGDAYWRIVDTVTYKSVSQGKFGQTAAPTKIPGLYGSYRIYLSCDAFLFPTCLSGMTISSIPV